jgi:hypothetical protein
VGEAFRWGDHETTARVIGPQNWDGGSLYYKIGRNRAASLEEDAANLLAQPEAKAAQRVASGLSDYRIRPGNVTRRTVGGRPALTCVADFTRDGAKWVEYLTWVSGQNSSALFFAQVPASELDALRQRLDPIIDSLMLP